MSKEQIRGACEFLFAPGQVVEVRALSDTGTFSGYYNDIDRLAADAEALDSTPQFKGIYFTLNPVNPALLARKVNRISKQGKTDASTSDQDITRRRWLPVDIDPTRPSGISSSNEEHEEALTKAKKIRGFLSEMGWPVPILADSGNGAHLLYRIDLPNDAEATQLVKDCLTTLSQFFTDARSSVDIANHNASRIWKLYGTVSRKGDNTEDRPHRRSEILEHPEDLNPVKVSDLMLLASLMTGDESKKSGSNATGGNSGTSNIDLGDWLSSHGIGYEEKPYSGGRLFVFDECPFSGAHKDGAYAIQFVSGAIFAGCHHNSCGGGEQRWKDLREMYEGCREGGAKRRPSQMTSEEFDQKRKQDARSKAEAKAEYYGNVSEIPKSSDQSVDIIPIDHTAEAARILREGNPAEYILNSFKMDHEGDDIVARCLIMSFASRSVINSNGLHVLVTGDSGKGKSHTFDTMLTHIPQEFRLGGRLSDKALFYAEDIRAGSAICLDDVGLSDQMQETLKGVTTSFKKPFIYRTVNKDRKGQTCIIPERCVWWVAKVEGSGDDQVWNRMLTCWIDDSQEQDDKVLERELEAAALLPADEDDLRFETVVCHHIWNQLTPVHVVIPYAKRIRFSSSANRRNPGMLLDLIKSVAALYQYQRERTLVRGRDVIYATTDDFRKACEIYLALNGECGSQASKLTRGEAALAVQMHASGRTEFTMEELIDLTHPRKKSYNAIKKILHGGSSHQIHYDGLLEKCPAISYLDRTDSTSEGVSKRQKVYTWNRHQYESWISGGGCWLDEGSDGADDDPDDDNVSGISGSSRKGSGSVPLTNERQDESEIQNNSLTNLETEYTRKEENVQSTHEPTVAYTSAPETFRVSANTSDQNSSANISKSNHETEASPISGDDPITSAKQGDFPLTALDPDDFHPINGVWSGPCAVCGGKWVQYTEKFSQKQKEEGRFAHKICQKCYSKAVARKCWSFTTLPGLLNTGTMILANKDLGRCDVCNTGAATWVDPETKQKICQVCYSREQKQTEATV